MMEPSSNFLTKRFALLLLAGLIMAVVHGANTQQDPIVQYMARVAPTTPGLSPKPLFVAVVDQLPGADVAHDRDHNLLVIRTTERVSFAQLNGWMASTGYLLLHLTTDASDVRTHLNNSALEAVPELNDTGNPELDQATYMDALQVWMLAHPVDGITAE